MLIKYLKNHVVIDSPTCGSVHEVITNTDGNPYGLAISENIKETHAHFHRTFEETYFLLDGELEVKIYEPETERLSTVHLKANELMVIPKGVHHKVVNGSEMNRLCIISFPPFHGDDENPSDKI